MTLTTRTPSALAAALRDIQNPVQDELVQVSDELWRIVFADVPLVQEVQQHLQGMKGKLFRPTLVLLASSLNGSVPQSAVTFGAVIELVHLATLVHDDAVDRSELRRGMPTVNARFSDQVSVIMGDYLYIRALRELATLGDIEAMRSVMMASNEMSLGEMRQMSNPSPLTFSEHDYRTLIKAKTASLFVAACELGSIAGAGAYRESLVHYGEWLGMAFQVADDLLDYTEDREMTGKPGGLDLREHKVTLPLIAAIPAMSPSQRQSVDTLFATPDPDDEAVNEVIAIVHELGGIEYARRRADDYAAEAERALAGVPDGPSRTALVDAISYVVERRW